VKIAFTFTLGRLKTKFVPK